MDEHQRTRFLEVLRADEGFRAAVRREILTAELLGLPDTVSALAGAVEQLRATVATLVEVAAQQRQDFTALAGDVHRYMQVVLQRFEAGFAEVSANLSGIKEDLSGVKEDLSGVKEDLSGVKDDLSGVKEDLSGVKDDLSGVKAELRELRRDTEAGFLSVKARFDQVEADLTDVKRRIA